MIKGISTRGSAPTSKRTADLEKVLSSRKADPGDIEAEIECPVTPREGRFESCYRYKKNDNGDPSESVGGEAGGGEWGGGASFESAQFSLVVLTSPAPPSPIPQSSSDQGRMPRCTLASPSMEAIEGSGWR